MAKTILIGSAAVTAMSLRACGIEMTSGRAGNTMAHKTPLPARFSGEFPCGVLYRAGFTTRLLDSVKPSGDRGV
jgi:hypothetical protein